METSVDFVLPVHLRQALQYALSYSGNEQNSKSHWRTAWVAVFNYFQEQRLSLTPSERLNTSPEYEVLLRGLTGQQVRQFTSVYKFKHKQYRSEDSQSSDSDSYGRSESEFQPGSQHGRCSSFLSTACYSEELDISPDQQVIDYPSQNESQISSPYLAENLPSSSPTLSSRSNSTLLEVQDSTLPLASNVLPQPSTTGTTPVKRGSDKCHAIDIALLRFYSIEGPTRSIHGYEVIGHSAHIPILLELKTAPSRRKAVPKIPDLESDYHLAHKLRNAYTDICDKLPHAFDSHPAQMSIITLACSGLWWCFAVVNRSDSDIIWSDCFTVGYPLHDEVLLNLVRGAVACPTHPGNNLGVQMVVRSHISPPEGEGGPLTPVPAEQ